MNSIGVSANLDNPESVLDALMQTIVCKVLLNVVYKTIDRRITTQLRKYLVQAES